jgi:predicted 2-oxoglutarate/Fe(II)-dependent dioxygenase YbiX
MGDEIINAAAYPLDDLESPAARDLIRAVRASLDLDGSCTLQEFVAPSVLHEMADEAKRIAHLAYPGPTEVSPYFFHYQLGEGQTLPDDHPLKRKGKRNLAQVAADLIPAEHLLSRLYRSPLMTSFLAAVLEQPVYRNQDPYQSLNISVMNPGGCQQWHFDSGNMVTTLLLQEPEDGGVFEYAPAIRSDDDEHFDQVQDVLDGCSDRVKRLELKAGTLSLFRGHYSLHRVTKVTGTRQRLQAILGYTTQPDLYGSKESSILHYGPRVAEIEARTPRYPDQVATG